MLVVYFQLISNSHNPSPFHNIFIIPFYQTYQKCHNFCSCKLPTIIYYIDFYLKIQSTRTKPLKCLQYKHTRANTMFYQGINLRRTYRENQIYLSNAYRREKKCLQQKNINELTPKMIYKQSNSTLETEFLLQLFALSRFSNNFFIRFFVVYFVWFPLHW